MLGSLDCMNEGFMYYEMCGLIKLTNNFRVTIFEMKIGFSILFFCALISIASNNY